MRDHRAQLRLRHEDQVCSIAAAVVAAAGSVVGGIASASGAGKAANAQMSMYNRTRGDLLPYNTAGQDAFGQYNAMEPFSFGQFSFNPTMEQLEATPGYQFAKTQGLKGVQNSASARGLGVSGAAEKGAAAFATGLADQTYQNQFANALNAYQANYGTASGIYGLNSNKLFQAATLGENAAAQTGAQGTKLAENQGQYLTGQGNAIGGAIQGATSPFAYYLMQPGTH